MGQNLSRGLWKEMNYDDSNKGTKVGKSGKKFYGFNPWTRKLTL